MKTLIKKAIFAGVLIGLAACVYMSCSNKIVGSMLFSIGLISVLVLDAYLFTGKIGYVDSKKKFIDCLVMLVFNLLSSYVVGLIYQYCIGGPNDIGNRFVDYQWYTVLFKGFGTGVLIYLGVELYKQTKNMIPVIICIMAFILSGFYHCVADACYLATSTITLDTLWYFLLVIIGNSLGSLTIRFLQKDI